MASHRRFVESARRDQFVGIGVGSYADVYQVADSDVALKIAWRPEEPEQTSESAIYERLGIWHPYILRTYGEAESVMGKGLVLQYLPHGILGKHLELSRFPEQRLDWPYQAAEAISYVHSKAIIHSDIGVHNFLVQNDGSLALIDFWGSSLDGSDAIVAPGARYGRPPTPEEIALKNFKEIKADDIFALGSLVYEIAVGHRLYAEKEDHEIMRLFRAGIYPDLDGLEPNMRRVVQGCWQGLYSDAEEVKRDLVGNVDLEPSVQRHYRWLPSFGLSLGVMLLVGVMSMRRLS